MMEMIIKPIEEEGPPGLSRVQVLGLLEVLEVLMVRPDFDWMPSTLEEVPPLLEAPHDCEELLVVHLVIPLDGRQALREECDRMPLPVQFRKLLQDTTSREVRSVRFDSKRLLVIRKSEDWRRGDSILQCCKGPNTHWKRKSHLF